MVFYHRSTYANAKRYNPYYVFPQPGKDPLLLEILEVVKGILTKRQLSSDTVTQVEGQEEAKFV
jgi:hypothetical protein